MLKTKAVVKKPPTVKPKAKSVAVKKPATVKAKASAVDVKKPATIKAKHRTKAVVKPKPRKRYKGGELQEDDIKNLLTAYFDFYNEHVKNGYEYPKYNQNDFLGRIKNINNMIDAFNTNLNGENTDSFKDLKIFKTLQEDFNLIYHTSYNDKNSNDYSIVINQFLNFTKRLEETIIVPIIEIIEIENNKFNKIYIELSIYYKDTDAYEDFLKKPS